MHEEVRLYIDAVPEGKPLFDQLHGLILALYPDAEVVIASQIPTYKVKSGEGEVALGYWKHGVSLYTGSSRLIKEFKEKHPAFKTGADSINFKVTDAVPAYDLKEIIKQAVEYPEVELIATT